MGVSTDALMHHVLQDAWRPNPHTVSQLQFLVPLRVEQPRTFADHLRSSSTWGRGSHLPGSTSTTPLAHVKANPFVQAQQLRLTVLCSLHPIEGYPMGVLSIRSSVCETFGRFAFWGGTCISNPRALQAHPSRLLWWQCQWRWGTAPQTDCGCSPLGQRPATSPSCCRAS